MSDTARRLWGAIEPYVAAEGVELDDLELLGQGRGSVLRVVLDAEGGLDVDRLADLSRGISRILDELDPVSGSYTLEVTTPGLERKLRRPRHYQKSVGRTVKVTTSTPVDDATVHEGELTAADEEAFTVKIGEADRQIRYADVSKARTVFEWKPAGKPKAGKPGGRR